MDLNKYSLDLSPLGIFKAIIYFLATSFTSTLAYINVKQEIVFALTLAMVFDTITGFIKTKRIGQKPSSKVGKKGILDKVLLLGAVLLLGVVGKLLLIDLSWFIVNVLILLTIFEVYSIFGNLLIARTGKEDVEEIDAVSLVIKIIRDYLKKLITKISEKLK